MIAPWTVTLPANKTNYTDHHTKLTTKRESTMRRMSEHTTNNLRSIVSSGVAPSYAQSIGDRLPASGVVLAMKN